MAMTMAQLCQSLSKIGQPHKTLSIPHESQICIRELQEAEEVHEAVGDIRNINTCFMNPGGALGNPENSATRA